MAFCRYVFVRAALVMYDEVILVSPQLPVVAFRWYTMSPAGHDQRRNGSARDPALSISKLAARACAARDRQNCAEAPSVRDVLVSRTCLAWVIIAFLHRLVVAVAEE